MNPVKQQTSPSLLHTAPLVPMWPALGWLCWDVTTTVDNTPVHAAFQVVLGFLPAAVAVVSTGFQALHVL